MKIYIIALCLLVATIFARKDSHVVANGVIYGKSVNAAGEYSHWYLVVGASESCGHKINGKTYNDYNYDSKSGEIIVWRACEGTLLFKGKMISSCIGSLVEDVDTPSSEFDGFCYDRNGLNPIKRVNQFTKCK